uniref:CSON011132 protein n=1 Tax=Culicoides sonorensis TaxID=179676 RepID=A0A336LF54_CULSO
MIIAFNLCRHLRPIKPFISQRLFHQSPIRFKVMNLKPITEESMRIKDKLTHNFKIIYRAPMQSYIKALSIACAVTSAGLAFIGIHAYINGLTLDDLQQRSSYGDRFVVSTNTTELALFMVSLVVFNIVMSLTIRRYPLRIWRNGENYVAVFQSHIPFVCRNFSFMKGQMEPMAVKGVLPWKDARYVVNGQRMILLDQYFKTPSELHRMLNEKYDYYVKE